MNAGCWVAHAEYAYPPEDYGLSWADNWEWDCDWRSGLHDEGFSWDWPDDRSWSWA